MSARYSFSKQRAAAPQRLRAVKTAPKRHACAARAAAVRTQFSRAGRAQLMRFEMQVIPLKSTAEYKKILSDFNARRFSSPSMQDEGH